MTGYNVEVVVSSESAIINGISSYYMGKGEMVTSSAASTKAAVPLRPKIILLGMKTQCRVLIQADLMMAERKCR